MVAEKTITPEVKSRRDYELIIIINPETSEEMVTSAVEAIKQFVTLRGGTVVEVAPWGKKKLAYSIKHFLEGIYIFLKLQMKASASKELEANLQISENIIRYLMVKTEE